MKLTKKFKYKKLSIVLCVLMVGTIQLNLQGIPNLKNKAYAATNQEITKEINAKVTTDVNKIWTIRFNSEVDFYSVRDRIRVNEVYNNSTSSSVPVSIEESGRMSVKINPPSGGYKKGQNYQITINKGAKGRDGKFLTKDNIMRFSIQGDNTAMAKVEVSPVLDMFKVINITGTTRPDIKKYKVEGNDYIFNLGEPSVNVIKDKSSVQVYFYGSDGTKIIGKATLSISNNSYDVPLDITSY
ncbi:hypothetical protein GCM10008905_23830 [Clostridium malenominatum]|uniref:SbsA Ig-like domain-containing protein n=1 Tax=Clostridium malenominatum TaxID=1539 RepID=A0ABP3U8A0_9CLOT